MIVTKKLLCRKKCSLVKQRGKKLITHRAREVSRKHASAKSDRTKATVKADKRGTMMMGGDYFLALCRPRIACYASVKYRCYHPDYFIVDKSRAQYVFPELPGHLGQIFVGKMPSTIFLLPG